MRISSPTKDVVAAVAVAAVFLWFSLSTVVPAERKQEGARWSNLPPEKKKEFEDEAKKRSWIEFTRHWTNINGCWFAESRFSGKPKTIQMTNVVVLVEAAEGLEDEWSKTGVRWAGSVIYRCAARREFTAEKGWGRWIPNPQVNYSHAVINSNSTWIVRGDFDEYFSIPRTRNK